MDTVEEDVNHLTMYVEGFAAVLRENSHLNNNLFSITKGVTSGRARGGPSKPKCKSCQEKIMQHRLSGSHDSSRVYLRVERCGMVGYEETYC